MTKVTMPRAVGHVTRDTSQADMDAELPEGTALITTTQAEAYAQAVRGEALEEAIAAVESCRTSGTIRYGTVSNCIDAIRTLIPK